MIESYYAGTYWRARPESAEACARRAARFFELLGRCDPAWARWYETADSWEEGHRHPRMTDAANFEKLFGEKENRIGDGFAFHLWTGERQEETSGVNGACGSAASEPPSACVLTPPGEGPLAERVLTASVMVEVLRAMALAWDPEWGVATS